MSTTVVEFAKSSKGHQPTMACCAGALMQGGGSALIRVRPKMRMPGLIPALPNSAPIDKDRLAA